MLVFGSVWLWLFCSDCQFPQAFLLLPAGAAAIRVLNCVRIVALILIGDAGVPAVAAGGFHSEAGWILFVALAAGSSLASLRVPWIAKTASRFTAAQLLPLRTNPTAAYLLPFLAILAAGMVA
jgi:exosortase/archaeosortase family protein